MLVMLMVGRDGYGDGDSYGVMRCNWFGWLVGWLVD